MHIGGEARSPVGVEANSAYAVNVQTVGGVLVDAGLIGAADLETARDLLRTPDNYTYGPLVVAW